MRHPRLPMTRLLEWSTGPWLRTPLLAIAILLCSLTERAQAQSSGADEEARALFQAGSVAFDEGRYENALEHFRRAYELSRRPALLYNVGVAAERVRHDEEALAAFQQFLREVPDTPQRTAVEARVAILERAIRDRTQPEESQEQPEAAPDEEETHPVESTSSDITGPVVLISSGGVLALAGAILVGVAAGDVASVEGAERGVSWASVSDAYSRSEPLSIAGGSAIGVGAALALGGVLWLAVGGATGEEPSVAFGPGSFSVRGSF